MTMDADLDGDLIVSLIITSEEDLFRLDRMWDEVETNRGEVAIVYDHIVGSGDGNFVVIIKRRTELEREKEAVDR